MNLLLRQVLDARHAHKAGMGVDRVSGGGWYDISRVFGRTAPELSAGELHRVRLVVCRYARDVDDATELFRTLGIDPDAQNPDGRAAPAPT